ncbi:MAG: hypothetical protein JSV91_08115 [Phycisphaerales bacterium]|nr:MAG: hypothetical protein JSV91_08115 [Phycisphaerales bacterium]
MKPQKHAGALTVGAATAMLLGAAATAGQDDSVSSLQLEVAQLRAEVARLSAELPADRIDEQRSEEIRSLVQDVLADADTRASLLQNGMTAGYDNGFFIRSTDGSFRLNLKGMIQFRFVYSSQDNAPEDNHRWGFEHSRTRFGFAGHVVDPTWQYLIWAGWGSNGGSLLLDAYIKKDLENNWSVQIGQFKSLTWREWSVSETRQQFVERSNLDARYGGLYTQGVMANYATEQFRMQFAVTDGLRTWNTPYGTGPATTTGTMPYQLSNEYAFSARAEYLLGGAWGQYADFESWNDEEPMYVLGGAVHYQSGEYGTVDDEAELLQWTVDGSFEFGGFNLYGAIIGNSIESSTVDRDEYGVLLQGGMFLNDDWELLARYEWGDMDTAGTDDLSIFTVGASRFWNRHGLKWTTDLGYSFNTVDAGWGGASRGWRGDTADQDGQMVLRSQIHLLF